MLGIESDCPSMEMAFMVVGDMDSQKLTCIAILFFRSCPNALNVLSLACTKAFMNSKSPGDIEDRDRMPTAVIILPPHFSMVCLIFEPLW